jgi:hypothetical protein
MTISSSARVFAGQGQQEIFQTEKERAEFQELGNSLVEEFQTVGVNIPSRTKQVEEEAQTRDALAQR